MRNRAMQLARIIFEKRHFTPVALIRVFATPPSGRY